MNFSQGTNIKLTYSKHKDAEVTNTINKRKKILEELGLTFEEIIINPAPNIFWADIKNNSIGMGCQGKGTSPEYCLASAYGEAIERLQNLFIKGKKSINFLLGNKENPAPIFIPNEIYKKIEINNLDYKDILQDFILSSNRFPYGEVNWDNISELLKYFFGEEAVFEPYENLLDNSLTFLPRELITFLSGSNGMCSGNTREEALVQGISEILERYVEEYIYLNNLTPPEISEDYLKNNFYDIYEVKVKLEEVTNCKIFLYDCSLNKKLPVVCLLLIDNKNRLYRKQFGAHPDFKIAIERCFTEVAQGTNLTEDFYRLLEMIPLKSSEKWNTFFEYTQRIDSHVGQIPIENFLKKTPSWEFKIWEDVSKKTNKELLNNLLCVLKNITKKVYIIDRSFLGIPTYKIYIPGISFFYKPSVFLYERTEEENNLQSIIEKGPFNQFKLTSGMRQVLLWYFENRKDFLPRLSYNNIPVPILYAGLLTEENRLEEAEKVLEEEKTKGDLWDCVYNAIKLKNKGINNKDITNIIKKFFCDSFSEYIANTWISGNIFPDIFNKKYSIKYNAPKIFSYSKNKKIDCSLEDLIKHLQEKVNIYYLSH